jgi:hypothetical protein
MNTRAITRKRCCTLTRFYPENGINDTYAVKGIISFVSHRRSSPKRVRALRLLSYLTFYVTCDILSTRTEVPLYSFRGQTGGSSPLNDLISSFKARNRYLGLLLL